MPGLLDLPPELIDRIYGAYKDPVGYEDGYTNNQLRLACRYLQQATRRTFCEKHFQLRVIRRPDDAQIEAFCASMKVPDIARSVNYLTIHTEDDKVTEARLLERGSKGNQLSDLVPPAFARHKDALLTALLACKNLTELGFCEYIPLESEASDQTRLRINSVFSRNFQPGAYDWDLSSSFDFVLALVAQAGLRPRRVSVYPFNSWGARTGLTSAAGLITANQALSKVHSLSLSLIEDLRYMLHHGNNGIPPLGEQLRDSLPNLPALTQLVLHDDRDSIDITAWQTFAAGPALPVLQDLHLRGCSARVVDFAGFILKHRGTLKELNLRGVFLQDGTTDELKDFLGRLQACSLVNLLWHGVFLNRKRLNFKAACIPHEWELDGEEEDYVMLLTNPVVSRTTVEDVREGLAMMIACMTHG